MNAASISPAEQAAMLKRREVEKAEMIAKRRKLAVALENVLGREDRRTEEQKVVWEYLTHEQWSVSRSTETNDMLIFEGQRRKAIEVAVLVDEAGKPQ